MLFQTHMIFILLNFLCSTEEIVKQSWKDIMIMTYSFTKMMKSTRLGLILIIVLFFQSSRGHAAELVIAGWCLASGRSLNQLSAWQDRLGLLHVLIHGDWSGQYKPQPD